MTKYISLLAIILILANMALLFSFIKRAGNSPEQTIVQINQNSYLVDVANNPALWAKGLSGRETLNQDEGMLFIFPNSIMRTFWMKGMNFNLDILWISENKIIGIAQNALPGMENLYKSPSPADMVLELSAGVVEKDNIQVGDIIKVIKNK